MILLLVLGCACLGGAIFLIGEALARPRRELRLSIQRAARGGPAAVHVAEVAVADGATRPHVGLSERAAALAMRLSPRTTPDAIALKLASAGLSSKIRAHEYLALRIALAAGGAVTGMVLGLAIGSALAATMFVCAVGVLGFYAPELYLNQRLRTRREHIRAGLPNALDLLTVSVEAGLGLDAAIARLSETTTGPLADELTILLGHMSVGERRVDALRALADRVDVPELASFARAVNQADQLGVSLGKTLRLQAEDVRKRRQAVAEERAAKVPVKMLFPTAFCIFPALFVIVLGPPLLRLLHGM